MTVRATMADLIIRTRLKIGDPAGGSETFTDQQVQDALDNHRTEVRYEGLRFAATFVTGGAEYHDYYSAHRDWEADVTFSNGVGTPYTPDTLEYTIGHFFFATSRMPPVYALGKVYDTAGAAVELARDWIAKLKLEFDFATVRDQFSRSQKIAHLETLIAQLNSERPVVTVDGERNDWRGAPVWP